MKFICNECGRMADADVVNQAVICPLCGKWNDLGVDSKTVTLPDTLIIPSIISEKTIKKDNFGSLGEALVSVFGVLFGIVVLVAIISLFTGNEKEHTFNSSSTNAVTINNAPGNSGAYVISQNYVKQYIKSPSTADFPIEADNISVSNDTFAVHGHLDAQNGFGATIRASYLCGMVYTGGEWSSLSNWKLLMLYIDDDLLYMEPGLAHRSKKHKSRHRN